MAGGCSIRALWILNNQDTVVFSRRFNVVERRWRAACKTENESCTDSEDNFKSVLLQSLPTDSELASAFAERKRREGSARGFGIRLPQSVELSDSWVDDPITRHVISLQINKQDDRENYLSWPLTMVIKSHYSILVLPLVQPRYLKAYEKMCKRSDCGNAVGVDGSLSSLLLDLPSITGAFMVGYTIADVAIGDIQEPDVVVAASATVGGLLDSLTGSIGISARPKPVAAPVALSINSGAAAGGAVASDAPKIGSKPLDKDLLRGFITSAFPFGTPIDLSYSSYCAIKTNGFSAAELPSADKKYPAWKPYLYKGKQRILFTIHETINAAMYDRDEIPDSISISGQVNCRAELEGLPDLLFPLSVLDTSRVEVLSFHPCAQIPEQGGDNKQSVIISPPLGNFVLIRYQALCNMGPPIKGFYQLSMVSENEGAFLFKLRLMEGYKSPLAMEFCTVTMPFPRRRVVSFDGTPTVGTVSFSEHSIEWKIIMSSRGAGGRTLEASFSGTVRFGPWQSQRRGPLQIGEEESDDETESANSMVNVEDFLMEKMNKDLQSVDLEEPFCWQAYNFAKVSFKIVGASLSGMLIDPKSVNTYPALKVPIESSTQVISGDYILWNTLGQCPVVAIPKV